MSKNVCTNENNNRENHDFPFDVLSREARDLYLNKTIERISVPSPLEFYREYVSKNKPVIITDAINNWPALHFWTNAYLRRKLSDVDVSIDITPDGHGDTVRSGYFVTPLEKKMGFTKFVDILEGNNDKFDGVPYCQHQNSSFSKEFSKLAGDVSQLSWANQAFGSKPDAVNFWMGDSRAVSSLHHDPYENIYAVIAGEKQFTLLPPTDLYWLGMKSFPKAHYEFDNIKKWKIIPDYEIVNEGTEASNKKEIFVPWFPVDPDEQIKEQLTKKNNHKNDKKKKKITLASPIINLEK